MCAERVAMFKALSEGHRGFRRIAVVADTPITDAALRRLPPDPVGVRRRHRGRSLANLEAVTASYRLSELLPHPFDRRLLE